GFGHFSVMTERVLCTPLMQSVVKRNFLFKQTAYLFAESFDVVQLVVADPFLQCEQLALDLVIVTFLPRTGNEVVHFLVQRSAVSEMFASNPISKLPILAIAQTKRCIVGRCGMLCTILRRVLKELALAQQCDRHS